MPMALIAGGGGIQFVCFRYIEFQNMGMIGKQYVPTGNPLKTLEKKKKKKKKDWERF